MLRSGRTGGIARLQAEFMDDGFILGETLAPVNYTGVYNADDHRMNNKGLIDSFLTRGITSTMATSSA